MVASVSYAGTDESKEVRMDYIPDWVLFKAFKHDHKVTLVFVPVEKKFTCVSAYCPIN